MISAKMIIVINTKVILNSAKMMLLIPKLSLGSLDESCFFSTVEQLGSLEILDFFLG